MEKHLPQEIKYHYIMRIFNGEKIVDIVNEVMIKNTLVQKLFIEPKP